MSPDAKIVTLPHEPAVRWPVFDADDEAFVSGLVSAGHASTAGYSDPRYPVAGRVPRTG